MRVAHALGHFTANQIIGILVGKPAHRAIEQRHIDVLTFAAGMAFVKRGHNAHRRIHAGHQVGNGNANFLRPATRQIVALAGDAHHTGHTLNHEIVTGTVAVRAGLAEAGD